MIKQDDRIVLQSKERSKTFGLDPSMIPTFTQFLSPHTLAQKMKTYEEILYVISSFMKEFLTSVEGTPFLVMTTDDEGYVLRLGGDSSIVDTVNQLGIKEGVRFIEEDAGVNSISLAIRHNQPVALVGKDHFFEMLHQAACYSVPFRSAGTKLLLGTITLFTLIPFNDPLFLVMLNVIVDSIERELLVREKNKQLFILNQGLLQTNFEAVIVTNAHGKIIVCNANGEQLLKRFFGKMEYVSTSILNTDKIGSYYNSVLLDQKECIGVELSLVYEGEVHYFILDVVPIFDESGLLICVVGTIRDISEMKNAEKLAMVGQMAAGVAHEIRNPLTTIQGLLQLSKDQFKSEEQYRLLMSEIDRMNLIVSDLLILAKPHAVQYEAVDCLVILNDILALFETQAIMNGISISRDIRSYGLISCDPNQIKQVFMNILKNSMEAMPNGGNLDIMVEMIGSEQLIRFIDNGEGIPEHVLLKMGQPFFTTKKFGNGLGIMVTKKIMDSHNGRIQFTSKEGSGTTVDIWLPLVTDTTTGQNRYVK